MKDLPLGLVEADGEILIATIGGVKQLSGGTIEAYPVLSGTPVQARALLRDRDGGLWVGSVNRGPSAMQ